jgi:hypothetical protein
MYMALETSVSDPEPDLIRSVDPDSGSGSKSAKMTHKKSED